MKKEQYLKLYKQLPKELQDLLSSDKLVDNLENICEKYNILQYLAHVNDYTGDVLLGLLSPDKFEETIKKELKLKEEEAKNITREINRYVFYPVKSLLEDLYNMEISPIAKMKMKPSLSKREVTPQKEIKKTEGKKEETEEKNDKKDVYREPIK